MDRRPRQPRQLAGENGSSEHWEASFDAAELPVERLFNAGADSFRPGVARDDAADAVRAADDVAFRPNCLGIQASIHDHPLTPGGIPLCNLRQICGSIIKLRLLPTTYSGSLRLISRFGNGNGWLTVFVRALCGICTCPLGRASISLKPTNRSPHPRRRSAATQARGAGRSALNGTSVK